MTYLNRLIQKSLIMLLPLAVMMLQADAPALAKKAGQPAEVPPLATEQEKRFPQKTNWSLMELDGKAPAGSEAPTLVIDDNMRGSGFSGCNTWSSALYPVRGQRLLMGSVALTRKACDPALMTLERSYLTILHSGPNWDLDSGFLVIKSKAGNLRFRPSI